MNTVLRKTVLVWIVFASISACSSGGLYDVYRDENTDFGLIRTVAILPLANLSKEDQAGERVRDVMFTMLMASSGIYVLPPGEVARGIAMAGVANPASPTSVDAVKLAAAVKADVVMTGVVREYGEARSAGSSSSMVSLSFQMMEGQSGKVVWTASATRGGVGFKDRLLGGGGEPMNIITEKAVNDILNKLFD